MKQSKNLTTGNLSDAVADAIREDYVVQAVPRLKADWNLNRYSTPTAINTPDDQDEGIDVETFPIESIINPLRPSKGILKARVDEAVTASTYQQPNDPKFYIGDEDDIYKYWTSPYRTDINGDFPLHTDGFTTARPRVEYNEVLSVNKIVIKIDNTWATPEVYTVHIKTTVAGAYGSAIGGTSPAMNTTTGELALYYNGTAWVTTRPANLVTTNVAGIEFRVNSLTSGVTKTGQTMSYKKRTGSFSTGLFTVATNTTGANSSLNIIAIEAHFEADLTDRLMNTEDSFEMAETSQLYPIGTITSNTSNLTLSNEDGIFNKENITSPYHGILEPNALLNLEYIYTIDGVDHSVQQFSMYTNDWASSDGTTAVALDDESKFLKEIKPRAVFYQGKAVTEIIWRLLDSVGFNNYEITAEDEIIEHTIPFFWTTGEETVWEVLDSLAQATQTAIYFDGNGKLQVRTRTAAFKDTESDWTLLGQNRGSDLADILENGLKVTNEYEANNIEVRYKTTKWKVGTSGKPALSAVWEPEAETVVVRSSQLVRDIINDSNNLFVDQKEVRLWPFKSKVQIDGEIIQYEGKQFVYYTGAGGAVKNWAIVKSEDERKTFNQKTLPEHRKKNHYTGALHITEREVWNTEKRNHLVEVNGWDAKGYINGNTRAKIGGFKHHKRESVITLNTPAAMKDAGDIMWVHRGTAGPSTGYKVQGTRIRFNKDNASTTQRAGIGFDQNFSEQGYYVEVTLTNRLDGAQDRKTRGEVTIYSRKGTNWHVLAKGHPVAIAPNIWYDLDVHVSRGGNDRIKAWLNGTLMAEGVASGSTKQNDQTGKISMYAKGKTNVSFEYFYGINNVKEPRDDFGYYDLQYGGVKGSLFQREYVWEILTRRKKIKKKKWRKEKFRKNQFFFDEFGPYVHEIREFDVQFDPNPVQYSRLFSTNEWYSAILEYNSDAFGARFIIANMSRNHAILKGEDRLIYAGGSAVVNQVFTVLGRDLEIADEESVTKKNEEAIRARGKIETELSSDWIQSKSMAEEIATWMAGHWSAGIDEITVEIFGNPLIEIGDVISIDFEREHMSPATHKYFVTTVSNGFETGITTRLVARRVRTVPAAQLT